MSPVPPSSPSSDHNKHHQTGAQSPGEFRNYTFLGIQATIQPNPSPVNRSCLWHLGHQVVLDCTKDPHGLGQVPWPPVQAGSPWPFIYIYIYMQVAQSCPNVRPHGLYPPGFSVHRISQARILEWVAISFSRGSSRPRDRTQVSHIAGGFFTSWATRGVCHPVWHDLF